MYNQGGKIHDNCEQKLVKNLPLIEKVVDTAMKLKDKCKSF